MSIAEGHKKNEGKMRSRGVVNRPSTAPWQKGNFKLKFLFIAKVIASLNEKEPL